MIKISYQPNLAESASATLDFLLQRPFLSIIFFGMRICCVLLCLGFCLKAFQEQMQVIDLVIVIFAIAWLFYFKALHKVIIKFSLKMQKIDHIFQDYMINKKYISWQTSKQTSHKINWKQLKIMYKNSTGYIVPLTGFRNSAKFLWFPRRGFGSCEQEQDFLDLAQTNLKVKNIK